MVGVTWMVLWCFPQEFFKKLLRDYEVSDCQHEDDDIPWDFDRLVGF